MNYIPPHLSRISIYLFPPTQNGSPLGILWSWSFAIVRASLWAALIELLPVYDCWHELTQLPAEFIFWACLHCAALRYCLGTSGRVWWETFQTGRCMFWLVGTPDEGRKGGVRRLPTVFNLSAMLFAFREDDKEINKPCVWSYRLSIQFKR